MQTIIAATLIGVFAICLALFTINKASKPKNSLKAA